MKATVSALPWIAPAHLLVLGMLVIPGLYVLWLSLQESTFGMSPRFVGLANYAHVLGDAYFWRALRNTLVIVVVVVHVELLLGLALALLFASGLPAKRFLLAAIALTSGLAAQPGRPGAAPGGPWEWRTEFSGAGTADIAEGTRALGSIRHTLTAAELTRRMTINAASSLSIGGAWRSFDFAGSTADVPGQLQSIALRVGYDRQLSAKWSLGIDATPGFYSDFEDLDSSDVNVPFGFRLMSANSRDFQWGIALMVDPWRPSPIIGGPGVRWQFAPGWTFVGFPGGICAHPDFLAACRHEPPQRHVSGRAGLWPPPRPAIVGQSTG